MRDLPNLDHFSKTDAFAVIYEIKLGQIPNRLVIGRTECIYDNLNPDFVTNFKIDFFFEENQQFEVHCYNMDDRDNQ